MTDYISREAANNALRECVSAYPNSFYNGIEVARTAIYKLPAADVAPVKHGKWETVMLDHERMGCRPTAHYCSECHQITWFRTFYCPNCGADMRESKQESKQVGIL